MLLKDCPVGSMVRLVSICGEGVNLPYWAGEFEVKKSYNRVYVTDADGDDRHDLSNDPYFQFEIVHPAPDPRITFMVGGQEFYVGQRVWSLTRLRDVKNGQELRAIGAHDNSLCVHALGSVIIYRFSLSNISTTPPTPHEWRRGDWARHEKRGVGFVLQTRREYVVLSFSDETSGEFLPSELTFISHSEPPE